MQEDLIYHNLNILRGQGERERESEREPTLSSDTPEKEVADHGYEFLKWREVRRGGGGKDAPKTKNKCHTDTNSRPIKHCS